MPETTVVLYILQKDRAYARTFTPLIKHAREYVDIHETNDSKSIGLIATTMQSLDISATIIHRGKEVKPESKMCFTDLGENEEFYIICEGGPIKPELIMTQLKATLAHDGNEAQPISMKINNTI